MFKNLLIKEIQTAIIDFRFWVVLVLCLSIIPLSFYVSVKNYSQQLSDYQQEVQTYRDHYSGSISASLPAEGVHPPSPLSIFARGLDARMPYKVITSRDGQYKIEYAQPDNRGDLMGKIDFAFIIVFVLSILALVFTFSAISGDKENGTFRAVLSNPVLRRQILLSKLLGNYLVFIIPFLFSVLIALIITYFSGVVPVFSAQLLPSILIMIGISLIFIFALFNLGLWMSSFAKTSILSINILLLIWIVIGLVIPKVSPIISEAVFPIESRSVFESKRALLFQNLTNEQNAEESTLYEEIRGRIRPGSQGISSGWDDINAEFDEKVVPVREKYENLIASEIGKLVADYDQRIKKQNRISELISSLSIINSVNNLMAEFSGTGYIESENFLKQANQFQQTVKQNVYDIFEVKIYRSKSGTTMSTSRKDDTESDVPLPILDNYKQVPVSEIFQRNWIEIVLLIFYAILFFAGAFVSFLRFDVR